ncbi:MAG: hypothetical protein NUV75_06790 [Gallionella sp.]|nr:hypothetical protein [Gallionella sp.]
MSFKNDFIHHEEHEDREGPSVGFSFLHTTRKGNACLKEISPLFFVCFVLFVVQARFSG